MLLQVVHGEETEDNDEKEYNDDEVISKNGV